MCLLGSASKKSLSFLYVTLILFGGDATMTSEREMISVMRRSLSKNVRRYASVGSNNRRTTSLSQRNKGTSTLFQFRVSDDGAAATTAHIHTFIDTPRVSRPFKIRSHPLSHTPARSHTCASWNTFTHVLVDAIGELEVIIP